MGEAEKSQASGSFRGFEARQDERQPRGPQAEQASPCGLLSRAATLRQLSGQVGSESPNRVPGTQAKSGGVLDG